MVDALRSAHRAVKPGGLVIDMRPDPTRRPRVIADGRVRGRLIQCPDADKRDERASAAVARLIQVGLYRRAWAGHLWHSTRFRDLTALDAYLSESARYCEYEAGNRRRLVPFRRGPFDLRRAIAFQVLERL